MIWLIGNKGMLGREVEALLQKKELSYIASDQEIDITSLDEMRIFSADKPITWVINCAAYTAVDKAEDEPDLAFKIFSAYLKSFFSQGAKQNRTIGAASARAGNVIGGGDWGADRLVPDCIRALSGHQSIGIRSPHAVRPWQHVLEPLSGYLQLGAALWQDPQKYSGAWNFGPENGSYLTVAEMADRLIKYWGSGAWDDLSDPKALHEANLLKLNCDKAHTELNWNSVLTIDECLQMTSQWYKFFYTVPLRDSMYDICTQQIAEYGERAKNKSLIWTKGMRP